MRGIQVVVRRWGGAAKDRGMSTAEYAVGTIAAVAFAAALYKVVSSPQVQALLTGVIKEAFQQVG